MSNSHCELLRELLASTTPDRASSLINRMAKRPSRQFFVVFGAYRDIVTEINH